MKNLLASSAFDMAGRHALVTGGYRGIGYAIAKALGEAGASVTVTGRDAVGVNAATAELIDSGVAATGIAMDVIDTESISNAFDLAEERIGQVDCLINNAGVSIAATALATSNETWRTVIDTNLDGVWNCSVEFARRLVATGSPGTIVNVGSISAWIVNQPRWQAPYLASKAAVHQLTKALAAEWAPHHIRVNAIAPGYILTELSPVDQPEYYDTCVAPAAMKRYGMPTELGPAAIFVASEASSFMTGSVITIDGGFTLF